VTAFKPGADELTQSAPSFELSAASSSTGRDSVAS